MTDDDFALNSADADQWDAIVTNEWLSDLGRGPMRVSGADDGTDPPPVDDETPHPMVVYRPCRPAMLGVAISAMLFEAAVWAAASYLAPAYQLAALTGVPRRHRAEAVHQLTVAAGFIAVIMILTATCGSFWLVSFARYRMRRTSHDQVAVGTLTSTR